MADLITAPGVYDVAKEDYHSDARLAFGPALSGSGAKLIMGDCPAVYFEQRQRPPVATAAWDAGTMAHKWTLEGDKFGDSFEPLADWINPRNDAGRAAIGKIRSVGKTPVSAGQMRRIVGMRDALQAHHIARRLFVSGAAERSLYWRDDEFGIWCRCRLDWLPDQSRIVGEYKTTRSASHGQSERDLYALGYYQQAEWNLSGIKALGLIEDPAFVFVFQEKEPPYLVTTKTAGNAAMHWAEMMNRKAKQTFARCEFEGHWPGYSDDEVRVMDLPAWAERQLTDREERGDFAI